jgi:hypothetical protein
MTRKKFVAILFFLAGMSFPWQSQAKQERATTSQEKASAEINTRAFVTPRRQSEVTTTFLTRDGKPQQVKLSVRAWGIPHTKERLSFPNKGFFIVYLRAGTMTTIINGEEQKHGSGEFWKVPQGVEMSFDVTSETATFETFSLP